MRELDHVQQRGIQQDSLAPTESTLAQAPQFPGEITPPAYDEMGPVLRGLSIDGEEKDFVQIDHTWFLNTTGSLVFDMNLREDYHRAAALIAHLKVDTGIDIRIGRGVDEAKSSESDTIFREDNLSQIYVDKSAAIIVPVTFPVSSPFFGADREFPSGNERWEKKFYKYFEKAQGILPPYPPEISQT